MRVNETRELVQAEIAVEQAHVDEVYMRLGHATRHARAVAQAGREIFTSDRDNFVREEDGTALFERDAFSFQAARRLAALDEHHDGLVFGRLDLSNHEIIHIGRMGIRDDDYEPLVIDWRARAAEPFYRATQMNPMGVVRRRVLRCRADRVIGLEDDLIDTSIDTDLPILGEGALMASLTRARDSSMRDIVATIQAEQDEAIRAPHPGVTIIGGGPGTGKTVVALHRAAYLLYTYRSRLEKGGVLVVGPSAVFMNYIARVLPSLGENSVTVRSIGAVASDALDMDSEIVDEPVAAAAKGGLRMVRLLRTLARTPLISEPQALRATVTVRGEVLSLDAQELAQIRHQILSNTQMNRGRDLALTLVVEALARKLPDDVVIEAQERDTSIRDHPALAMFMNAWWPMLSASDVLRRLADETLVEKLATDFSDAEKAALVRSYHRDQWSIADMALLDELLEILGPLPQEPSEDAAVFIEGGDEVPELVTTADLLRDERTIEDLHDTYAHILVDEAQDITPMQWRMLRRRGPRASWTLVGDPAQSWYPDAQESNRAIADLVGRSQLRRFTLSTNYRSSKEIFDLATQVITAVEPDADLPTAVRSTGHHPVLAEATEATLRADLTAWVEQLATEVAGTIAVICPRERLPRIGSDLAEALDADVLGRLSVLPALTTKGLEYDAVVVLAPDEIVAEGAGGVRLLYVALTRATHRLVTLDLETHRWRPSVEL